MAANRGGGVSLVALILYYILLCHIVLLYYIIPYFNFMAVQGGGGVSLVALNDQVMACYIVSGGLWSIMRAPQACNIHFRGGGDAKKLEVTSIWEN